MRQGTTTKKEALEVECPKCNAALGQRCVEQDEVTWRPKLHIDRHVLAISRGARVRYIGGTRVYYADEREEAA